MHPFKRTLLSLLIVSLIASLILPGYLSLAQGKKVVITIMGMEGQPWVPKELREWIKHYIESKLPNVEIKFIGMPLSVDVYHQKLVTLLTAKSPEPDIFAIDVIWPAELVEAGWVEPLNKYVTPEFRAKFIKPLFDSYVYKGVITGIRFMADAAGLYVRKDLLDEFGFKPPKTYYELVKEARAILKKYPNMYGFVWQGAKYEGLVCAWLEFHYAFGSKFFDKNGNVVINSPQGVKALQFMVDLIYKYKVTPKAVTTWKEEDTRIAFTEGKAIFLRNWPYVAGIASDPKRSKVVGKWILVPNPVGPANVSASVLGGWALAINPYSKHKDLAWKVLELRVSDPVLKKWVLMTGQCPPVKSLFHDPDIIEKYPYMPWIEKVFEHAVWRPHHPMYTHISHILQEEIHAALTGLKSPKAALDSAARRIAKLLGVGCPYCKS